MEGSKAPHHLKTDGAQLAELLPRIRYCGYFTDSM